jgi:dTDP-4-amino-4,6-dideoxygalactose transaminase
VITSPFSFFATPEAILRVGATPRFVDIDPETLMLSPEATERALGPRTKAILPVHLYGHAASVDQLASIAERAGLVLVEDAAQAFGAKLAGRSLGCWGKLGCLSFFPTKPLGAAGDGGMVVTADEELSARLRRLRVHGATGRHVHGEWSGNYRLDAIQAAVLRVKLPHVPRWQAARSERARRYEEGLRELRSIQTLTPREKEAPCHALFTVRVVDGSRDRLLAFLRENGIATAVHYPTPLYAQKALGHLAVERNQFPNTELACRQVLSLPLFASMTNDEVDTVVGAVRSFYS